MAKRHFNDFNNNNSYSNSHNHSNQNHNDYGAPATKRRRIDENRDYSAIEGTNQSLGVLAASSMDQQMIAKHYGNRTNTELEKREQSSIIQLRKINNWVKSVLINKFCHTKASVLDIGGGKGGDLNKWSHQRIEQLVHVDHAIGSIMDCKQRYNDGVAKNKFSFAMKLICADAFGRLISDSLDEDIYFDLVSSQFALHYAFETKERVHAMLTNVTQRLREDGYFIGTIPDANVLVQKWRSKPPDCHEFGNSKYKVQFKTNTSMHAQMDRKKLLNLDNPYAIRYMFNLDDAVDCPEYLLHFDNFVKIAEQAPYELELVYDCNFHEFFVRNYDDNVFRKLLQKIGILDPFTGKGEIYNNQWEIAYLYKVFVFKKKRTQNKTYPVRKTQTVKDILDGDIIVCQ
eukprot:CAMPEP_0197020634 /NCGR_PEP_ID=MMETSP1384-20130603/1478_1 /TAXON_ID=29189 /ORGANISM="Ammonia sp." /LENGTH=399 /DNA_ID=CAMNT_0042448297 /DNA_START=19 /DNA_END=1218 /DNA_ORIENTATION=+